MYVYILTLLIYQAVPPKKIYDLLGGERASLRMGCVKTLRQFAAKRSADSVSASASHRETPSAFNAFEAQRTSSGACGPSIIDQDGVSFMICTVTSCRYI